MNKSWSREPPGYVDKCISWSPQLIKKPMEEKKEKRGKETGTKIGTRRKGEGYHTSSHRVKLKRIHLGREFTVYHSSSVTFVPLTLVFFYSDVIKSSRGV